MVCTFNFVNNLDLYAFFGKKNIQGYRLGIRFVEHRLGMIYLKRI